MCVRVHVGVYVQTFEILVVPQFLVNAHLKPAKHGGDEGVGGFLGDANAHSQTLIAGA